MTKKKQKPQKGKQTKTKKPVFEKKELKIILSILALGFLLRLIYILETQSSPFIQNLFSDSKIYYDWAKDIASADNWLGDKVFFMSPGYPYFLAVVFKLVGSSIFTIRIIQALISVTNIFLIYLLTKNLFNSKSGFIAAGLASIYSVFIFFSGAVFGETLQTFLVTALLYLLTKEENVSTKNKWFLSGLLLGLSALFRANILIIFPVLIFWIYNSFKKSDSLKSKLKETLIYFTIGTAIPILPATLNNYIAGKEFVLLTSNGGINFYLGNNEKALGVYSTPKDFDFFKDMAGINYAKKITHKELTPSQSSTYWYGQGLSFIFSHPIEAITLTFKKLLFFFDDDENPQTSQINIDFFRNTYSSVLKIPLPNFIVVFLFAIAGIIYSLKKLKDKKITLMYFLMLAYVLGTIIFFVSGRFRIAITPLFISFAGFGIVNLMEIIKQKDFKELLIPGLSALIVLVLVVFIAPKYHYSYADAYSNLGNVYFDQKNYNEALLNYNESLKLKETELTYVLIGNTMAVKNDFNNAYRAYQNALKINPNYALAYFNLGLLNSQTGNFDDALKQFDKSIKIDPLFAEAYRNTAIIYYMTENFEQSLFNFEKYYSLITDESIKATVIQDINELKKKLNK
jgi:tetratricopeptide (TPR) repeat protein